MNLNSPQIKVTTAALIVLPFSFYLDSPLHEFYPGNERGRDF